MRRKQSLSPELTPLEARSLLAVVGLQLMAHPDTIGPPDGRTVEVTVMASFTDTTPATLPSVSYQVTDEYGQVQPVGTASLVRQPNGAYAVSLPVELEAKVRSGDKDGRQYTVSVTVGDDGTSKTGSAVVTAAPPAGRAAAARFEISFLKGMIPHHQMAISMSQIALRNSESPQVRSLAQRIIKE